MFESLPEITRTHYSRCWVQKGALDVPSHNSFYFMTKLAREAVYEVQKDVLYAEFHNELNVAKGIFTLGQGFPFFGSLIIRDASIIMTPNVEDKDNVWFFTLTHSVHPNRNADRECFCVTSFAPEGYDLAVASILIIAKCFFPEKILLQPQHSHWADALKIAERVNAPVDALPSRIPSDRLW